MRTQNPNLHLSRLETDTVFMEMENELVPQDDPSLDKIIEAITDRKNAWKKIILELEKENKKPKNG